MVFYVLNVLIFFFPACIPVAHLLLSCTSLLSSPTRALQIIQQASKQAQAEFFNNRSETLHLQNTSEISHYIVVQHKVNFRPGFSGKDAKY